MNSSKFRIRRANSDDRGAWESLWNAYRVFYKSEPDSNITTTLWQRLFDCQHAIEGFVVEQIDNRKLVGFVHYFAHPSTWGANPVCYLEDLFTDPDCRGEGIGRALIDMVNSEARERNWDDVYWHTQQDNHQARVLYDKLTGGTDGFVCYRIEAADV